MAGLRAEAISALNILETGLGKRGGLTPKYRSDLEKAADKGEVPFFQTLTSIYFKETNSADRLDSKKGFSAVFGDIFEYFSFMGKASFKGEFNANNFNEKLKPATSKYITAANRELETLTKISAEIGKTSPDKNALKKLIESLNPLLQTSGMNAFLKSTDGTAPTNNLLSGKEPEKLIEENFSLITGIATHSGGKYTQKTDTNLSVDSPEAAESLISHLIQVDAETGVNVQSVWKEFHLDKGTVSTEKPTHTADKAALEDALKAEAKMFNKKDTELPALIDSSGNIDWKAVQEFMKGFAEHTPEGGSKTTVDAQVAKLVEILKAHGTGLSDLTPKNLDAKITEMLKKSDNPENKGFWFGGGVVNWGITLIAAVLAALGFKSADDSKKELKKAAQERMTQEAQIADVIRQVMTQAQRDVSSLANKVSSLERNIKTQTANRTPGKKSQRKKSTPRQYNAPEGHETIQMNAPTKHATIRMNAAGDEVDGAPTDSMNDTTGGNTGSIENDLPPVDDGMNQDMNPVDEENDQVDGNNDVVDENQNDGNNQVGDEDGGDSAANSTIDGQPNSTRPMEGEGNNIVPKSKRVYISRGDGQPINVTKHAPAAVTTINFESDRYGNIPKKVTNKGGGDFDNE